MESGATLIVPLPFFLHFFRCPLASLIQLVFLLRNDERQSIRDYSDNHQLRHADSSSSPFCMKLVILISDRAEDA